jgi:hexulose-6-phosphate isomerase
MKKSISQWSFPAGLTMDECLAWAKDAGFEGIEIALEEDPDGARAAMGMLTVERVATQAKAIRKAADKAGLGIAAVATGLLWTYPLTADDTQVRAKARRLTEATLKAGSILGVDTALVIPGVVAAPFGPPVAPVPYDLCYQRCREAVTALIPAARKYGVKLGLEPVWNGFLLSPLEWADFVDSFQSPWVSVYFDVGNVLRTGFPEQWIRILGRRISRVHVKDFKRSVDTLSGFCDLLDGDVNWPEVMAALREIGYDGWVTAEVMPPNPHAPEHILQVNSLAMDRIFAM